MPPLNISIFDNRAFGRTPLVGTHSVIHMREYKRDDKRFQAALPAPQEVPEAAQTAGAESGGAAGKNT